MLTWTRRLPDDYAACPASHSRHIFSDVSVDRTVYRTGDSSSARTAIFTSSFWATYLACGTWTKRRKKSATLRRRSLGTSDVGISRNACTVVPGVDGFKRLRLTPKLFEWFLDSSRLFSDGGGGAIVFFTAIGTRIITAWLISLPISLNNTGIRHDQAYLIAVRRVKRSYCWPC